jgi:hypothetical protein
MLSRKLVVRVPNAVLLLYLPVLSFLGSCLFWLACHIPSLEGGGSGALPHLQTWWYWLFHGVFQIRIGYWPEPFSIKNIMLFAWTTMVAVYILLMMHITRLSQQAVHRYVYLAAILAGLPLLLLPNLLSSDVYDYIVHARSPLIYRANPYITAPAVLPADPFVRHVGWPDQAYVYGPAWLYVSMMVARVARLVQADVFAHVLIFKLFALGVHLANGVLLGLILERRQTPDAHLWTAVYLLNPLALIEFAGNAHNEAVMIFFILAGFLVNEHSHPVWGSALLATGVMTKIYCLPVVFLLPHREHGAEEWYRSAS